MWLGKCKPLNANHYSTKFCVYRSCESTDKIFLICLVKSCDVVIKGYMTWRVGGPHPMPKVTTMPNLMHIGLMELEKKKKFFSTCGNMWLCKSEPLTLSYHSDKFDAYRSCGRDVFILLRRATWPHDPGSPSLKLPPYQVWWLKVLWQ